MQQVIKLSSPSTHEFWEIPVLYEDAHLLAIDKPAGLLSSPDRHDANRPNLMKLLHAGIEEAKPWATERNLSYLMNAHRLDYETSGVLLLAKTKPVLVQLANLFGSEKPVKKYVALVVGNPEKDSFEIDAKLGRHPAQAGFVRIDPRRGKRAITVFKVAERFGAFTLLICEPLTERMHQIRAHLRWAKLPIVGDEMYGGKPLLLSRIKRGYQFRSSQPERPLMARVALHAERLELPHPSTGESLAITAPWPKDLSVAVKYLKKFQNRAVLSEHA